MDGDNDPFGDSWANDPLGLDCAEFGSHLAAESPPIGDEHSAAPVSVAAATLAGWAGVRALRARLRRTQSRPINSAPASAAAIDATPLAQVAATRSDDASATERATLVALCVELDDVLVNEAHRQKLRRGLHSVGVDVIDPVGERFDPERHCAVGTEPSASTADDLGIARVERVGFSDHGVDVRLPEVIVYRTGDPR